MDPICITKVISVFFVPSTMYTAPMTTFDPHLSCNELICYFENTDSISTIGSYTIRNVPGKIVLYPAGNWERYTVKRRTHSCCMDIFFESARPLPHEVIEFEPGKVAHLQGLFQKAHRIWQKNDPQTPYALLSVVYEILGGLALARATAYLPSRKMQQLAPADAYLEDHLFSPDFSYKALLTATGLSYTYFHTLFVQKYGTTPEKYVEYRRLKYACELLRTKQVSVSKIAETVGYNSVYYFSRVFRKAYGVPPSGYQKFIADERNQTG